MSAREDDRPRPDGADRYAIYSVERAGLLHGGQHKTAPRTRLAETSLSGIGMTLDALRNPRDGEPATITNDTRVGILDRETRQWLVNPWAAGR